MLVLGIDPGTASTGFGLVSSSGARLTAIDHGVIMTRAGVAPERRLAQIHARICELLDEHRPDALAVEELYFGANVQTAFAVGQARGVVLLAAGQRGMDARSYTPQQVKAAVCGSGRAAKDQVGRMVARLLDLAAVPTPDHAADALAVAICELNRAPLLGAVATLGARPAAGITAGSGPPRRRSSGSPVSPATLARARQGSVVAQPSLPGAGG
jgi:crossover junction endodeoxyribonuclease RuvC